MEILREVRCPRGPCLSDLACSSTAMASSSSKSHWERGACKTRGAPLSGVFRCHFYAEALATKLLAACKALAGAPVPPALARDAFEGAASRERQRRRLREAVVRARLLELLHAAVRAAHSRSAGRASERPRAGAFGPLLRPFPQEKGLRGCRKQGIRRGANPALGSALAC